MQRFRNILCVMVPDSDGGSVLEQASDLASKNQARLTVVTVIDTISSDTRLLDRVASLDELQEKVVAQHQQELEALIAPWKRNIDVQTKVLTGTPFLEIIREVLHNGHDIVIKTAEDGGLLDRVFGSDDMHLLRKCPCPVWLVKHKLSKASREILAAVDVSDFYPPKELDSRHALNCQILEMAISLALSESAELHVVYVWDAADVSAMQGVQRAPEEEIVAYVEEVRQDSEQNLNKLLEEILSKPGQQDAWEYFNLKTHLPRGAAHNQIPALADNIDAGLVIMGTVCRTGISGFFIGNTAENILNRLDCSILAIKPPKFVTPITLDD